MRRMIMTFGVSAALAVAMAVPAAVGAIPSAAAATTPYEIFSSLNSKELLDHGQGHLVTMGVTEYSTYYLIKDGTSKWYELKDTTGGNQCLDLVGITGGYAVNTEPCNFRSAELWWIVSGVNSQTQLINQYGTTLLGHDACLWNNTTGTSPLVQVCKSGQPSNQLWNFDPH